MSDILEQFKKEFPHVYTWIDEVGRKYPKHKHVGKVSLFVTKGSVTFYFTETGEEKIIKQGELFDVPVGILHEALVGDEGCEYIIGEMIKGDS